MIELLPLLPFILLLLFAAGSDIATMTIPNWVSIAMAALFPAVALALGMPLTQIGMHVLCGAAMLIVCYLMFSASIMGGGDAKLIAAAAVWTGFGALGPFVVWIALTGGVIALALLVTRKWVKPDPARPAFLNRLLKPRGGVPYAVAIMAGGLAVLDSLTLGAPALLAPGG